MTNSDYFFYSTQEYCFYEIEQLVNFYVNNDYFRKLRKNAKNVKKFIYIDIEYKDQFLIRFNPGERVILTQSFKYDKSLYYYLVHRLSEITGWSNLIIKSYFIYE